MPRDSERSGTRRLFLESTAASGLAAGLIGAPIVSAQSDPAEYVTWECDHVALTGTEDVESVRVDFQDGSYVQSMNGIDDADPVRLGSPGRTVDTATVTLFDGTEATLENPSPECNRRRLATEFTATQVYLPPAEFVLSSSVPSVLTTSVTLHFADGTSQNKQHYAEDGHGDVDDFPELPGIEDRFGLDAVPNIYRGTGEHEGKAIEAIEVNTDESYRTHYLRSDCVEDCQYGAETAQERIVEVVGTSEGEVHYELTATGPIRPVAINRTIRNEDNDDLRQNDDGTWTVDGFTGNTGYGDSWVVNGEITRLEKTGGDGEYVVRSLERRRLDY